MPRPDAILEKRVVLEGLLEFSLLLKVAPDKWNPNKEPVEGTTYADFDLGGIDKPQVNEGYGSYILTGAVNVESQDDNDPQPWLGFWFARAKSAAEIAIPVRETPNTEPHPWLPILVALTPEADPLPRSGAIVTAEGEGIANSTRYVWRRRYIPDASEGSGLLIREYTSPTQFAVPQHEAPQGVDVYVELPGSGDISFPPCLTKGFTISGLSTGRAQVVNDVASEVKSGTDAITIPRTNFTTWEPYISQASQQYTNGIWHLKEYLRIPPEMPRTIERLTR